MSRRASSKVHPGLIIGIVAAIGVLFFVGMKFIGKSKPAGFGDVSKLVMDDVLQNANSLRGSEYVVEGKVVDKPRWTADHGQVVVVLVTVDGKGPVGTDGKGESLGIVIPPEFSKLNIDREQRYAFRVKFRQGGIPEATGINRL